ncbi:FAD-dependent oxidoreductase [Microbacterium sp. X-17]|uniref:NAD(P)/FAD-dependent oxidoreductase n=1 Tax=Microbacterium sp. X-17 TaxID=3144404 RepID=UPI0031F5C7C1
MLLDQADIVVVGGGIVGMTTAYALKKRGFDVVVVEQRFAAFGASGRNSGGIWVQTVRGGVELELARRGSALYEAFLDDLGDTFEYRRDGGLIYFETDAQRRILQDYVADRAEHGIQAEIISAVEARNLSSGVPDSAIGAVLSSDDAQVNTAKFTRALADACKRRGVRLYENTPVLGMTRHGDAVTGVRTVRGDISAGGVVWCTGAWASALSAEGMDLPITPIRVGMLMTQPVANQVHVQTRGPHGVENFSALTSLSAFEPTEFETLDLPEGSSLTFEDVVTQNAEGNIIVGHTHDDAQSLNPHITVDATGVMLRSLQRRKNGFGELGVTGLWAGLVGVTADRLPIIDKVDGLYVNTGHVSGTASGPLAGELMAQLVAGEEPTIPLGPFARHRDSLIENNLRR